MATKTIDYANAFFKDADGNVGHVHGLSKNDITTLKNGIANAVVTPNIDQNISGTKTFTLALKATATVNMADATYMRIPEPDYGNTARTTVKESSVIGGKQQPVTMKWVRDYLTSSWDPGFNGTASGRNTGSYKFPMWHGFSYRGAQLIGTNCLYATFDDFKKDWSNAGAGDMDLCLGDYFSVTVGTTNYYLVVADIDVAPTNNYGTHNVTFLVTTGETVAMNSTASTATGYTGSTMHKTTLPAHYTALGNTEDAPFYGGGGYTTNHIVSADMQLSAGIDSTKANMCDSSLTGVTSTLDYISANLVIPTEVDILGHHMLTGSRWDDCNSRQLAIFRYISLYDLTKVLEAAGCTTNFASTHIWTRSIASSTEYVALEATSSGIQADAVDANNAGCCPIFMMTVWGM